MQIATSEQMSAGEGLEWALSLTRQTIAILDQVNAPADIAADLDLATHRMRKAIEDSGNR